MNNKIIFKLLLLSLILIGKQEFFYSQNLLSNPTFDGVYGTNGEYLGCAPGYFYNPNWNGNPSSIINLTKSNSIYRSAPSSQRVIINNISGYCYFAQEFIVKGERTLKASIWVKSGSINRSSEKQKIELIIRSDVPQYQHIALKEFEIEDNNQWQKIEVTGNTNCLVNGNEEQKFYFLINFKTQGTLYLDDASVTDETYFLDDFSNLILNTSFEGNYGTQGEYLGCATNYFYNPNWSGSPSSNVIFSKDIHNSISGKACQKVVVNSLSGYCYFAQAFNVQQNRKLKATLWVKSTGNNFELDFALRSRSLYNPFIAKTTFTISPNKWQKIEIYGDTKNLVTNNGLDNIDFFINLKSMGTVFFENATVTDITDLTLENIENGLPNLLENADFEYDYNNEGLAEDYEYNPNWSGGGNSAIATFSKDSCTPQNGLSCQKIVVSSKPTIFHYSQRFGTEGNKIFKASFWAKSPDGVEIDFTLRAPELPYAPPIYSAKTLKVSNEWQKIEIIGGLGSVVDEDEIYELEFFLNFRTTGTLFIDNASVVDVTDIITQKEVSVTTSDEVIPRTFFGMHINRLGSDTDLIYEGIHQVWPPVNFGMLRMWDTGTKWSDVENSNNQWNWDRLDLYVDKRDNSDTDCQIIYTLGMPANWATNSIDPFGGYIPPAYTSVSSLSEWEEYVNEIGWEYNNRIKYWEVWNEVEVFFSQGENNQGVTLNELAKSAYDILKGINPNNIILTPNFTRSTGASEFLFNCNGDYYFDVFSFHKYTGIKPEKDIGVFYGYRNLLDNYGLNNIPIWNTEGANTNGFNGPCGSNELSCEKKRIGAVSRAYIIQWLYDVKNFNWYFWEPYISSTENWVNTGTVLSSFDNETKTFELTVAGNAYGNLVNWLVGKKVESKSIDGSGNWTIKLFNPDTEDYEFIIWNENNIESSYNINEIWNVNSREDLYGNTQQIFSNTIIVDSAPILLFHNLNIDKIKYTDIKNIGNKISIFPNPGNIVLNIYKTEKDMLYTANLYDLSGKLIIKNIKLEDEVTTLNVENIKQGVYLLEITNEQEKVSIHKIVVN